MGQQEMMDGFSDVFREYFKRRRSVLTFMINEEVERKNDIEERIVELQIVRDSYAQPHEELSRSRFVKAMGVLPKKEGFLQD